MLQNNLRCNNKFNCHIKIADINLSSAFLLKCFKIASKTGVAVIIVKKDCIIIDFLAVVQYYDPVALCHNVI